MFDLDGVLTKTASVHAKAWKELFDAYLKERAGQMGDRFVPFDPVKDYNEYVDGKPREDGVRSFLASRHVDLPEHTIHDLGSRKDTIFLKLIHEHGVETYEGSVRYVKAARAEGLKTAVVSSSKNCSEVLRAAGIHELFDGQVDGNIAEQDHLKGKPAPDTYLRAARMLGANAKQAAVYEDALAGVEAGRAGGFGLVVGVDRVGQRDALRSHGADVVVDDLAELITAA